MFFTRLITLGCLLLLSLTTVAEPNKQALKYIREKTFDKAEEQIIKSLEKDSINPAGHYLAGLIHVQQEYSYFNIDTAYYHTLIAEGQWEITELKDQQKFMRIGITPDSIAALRENIEILAYERAVGMLDIKAFEDFFSRFDNDSLDVLITIKRDSLAYSKALTSNTWEGYEKFFNLYPKSLQKSQAVEKYHELIFEEKANNKSADEIERFLESIPETPYRTVLEKQLLLHYTIANTPESYLKFLRKYPDSQNRRLALNALYHVAESAENYTFPANLMSDSLRKEKALEELDLIPFFNNGHYGFFSAIDGKQVIPADLESIDGKYLCGVSEDVLLNVTSNGKEYLMNRSGKLVMADVEKFELLANGLVKIEKDGKYGSMLVSGELILPIDFDVIEMVGDNYLKAKKGDKLILYSYLGKRMLTGEYEDISYLGGNVITLTNGGKMALLNLEAFANGDYNENRVSFIYKDIEAYDKKYILGFSERAESLMNFKLEELIPLGIHEIYVEGKFVYTKSKWGYKLFDLENNMLKVDLYQEIQTGSNKLGIKKNNKWNLFRDELNSEPALDLDSIFFLTDKVTIVVNSGIRKVLFDTGAEVELKAGQRVESLNNSLSNIKTDFLLLNNGDGVIELIEPTGKSLFSFTGLGVEQVSESVYLLKTSKGMKLVDENGKSILKRTYELIEPELQHGRMTLHLLDKGKLGIYNPQNEILISPEYLQKIDLLSDTIYITRTESGAGIVNVNRKDKTQFEYDDIKSLNDTLILAKEGDMWSLVDLNTGEAILSDIIQIYDKFDYGSFQQVKFRQAGGYGLLDSRFGVFLPGLYNEIVTLKSSDSTYFSAERFLADSEFYIILYVDKDGKKIKSIAYREAEYDNILCEN